MFRNNTTHKIKRSKLETHKHSSWLINTCAESSASTINKVQKGKCVFGICVPLRGQTVAMTSRIISGGLQAEWVNTCDLLTVPGPNERHKMQRQKPSCLLKKQGTDGVNSNEEIKRVAPRGLIICTTSCTHGFQCRTREEMTGLRRRQGGRESTLSAIRSHCSGKTVCSTDLNLHYTIKDLICPQWRRGPSSTYADL